MYLTLIVSLDSLPPDKLAPDLVVTCLLNEEVRQVPSEMNSMSSHNEAMVATLKK